MNGYNHLDADWLKSSPWRRLVISPWCWLVAYTGVDTLIIKMSNQRIASYEEDTDWQADPWMVNGKLSKYKSNIRLLLSISIS